MASFIRKLSFTCVILVGLGILSLFHLNTNQLSNSVNTNRAKRFGANKTFGDFRIRKILTKARIRNSELAYNNKLKDEHREMEDDAPLPMDTKANQLYIQSIQHGENSQPSLEEKPKLVRNTKDSIGDKSHKFSVEHSEKAILRSLHPDFHPVGRPDVLVYSAHYDATIGTVKVVGLGPMADNSSFLDDLMCIVFDRSGINETVPLESYYHISTFSPWEGQTLDSYLYQCKSRFHNPALTVLSSSRDNSHSVQLPLDLRLIPSGNGFQYTFAVCVEPIVKSFNDTYAIRHYIAANTMYGAEHFYFYLTDASPKVEVLLQRLEMVTVYKWRLGDLLKQTHAFAQKAAYAHCLHNHRNKAQYLAFIDIDEVLVPRMHSDWYDMVDFLKEDRPNAGAMIFQSKMFPKNIVQNLTNSTKSTKYITKNKIVSLSATKTVGLFPLYQWSKVLVETTRTEIMDIHKVRQMYSDYEILNVKPDIGVVHHYRHYDNTHEVMSEDNHMTQMMGKLLNTYQHLFNRECVVLRSSACGLISAP